MTKKMNTNVIIKNEIDSIKDELLILGLDSEIKLYKNHKYLLIEKLISSADIPTFAKFKYKKSDSIFSNLSIKKHAEADYLFYKSIDEIEKFEKKNKDFFCKTKQSNIYMPNEFFEFLDLQNPRINKGYNLNEKNNISVLLVNKNLSKYFNKNITNKTLKYYGHVEKAKDININKKKFSIIDCHVAVHGLGTRNDTILHNLRGNVFVKDKICIILEKNEHDSNRKVYIAFLRNPQFFIVNKLINNSYVTSCFENLVLPNTTEESRKGQTKWRADLAELILSNSDDDEDIITCPISGLEVHYPQEATLLRASHIKEYKFCKVNGKINLNEAYDLNNGLLLSANADALFDKHMLSIDPTTSKLYFSKLISSSLKKKLNYNDVVRDLNNEQKKYLKIHFTKFNQLEEKR